MVSGPQAGPAAAMVSATMGGVETLDTEAAKLGLNSNCVLGRRWGGTRRVREGEKGGKGGQMVVLGWLGDRVGPSAPAATQGFTGGGDGGKK